MKKVYWNGRFLDETEACLPLSDPAVMYGLGAFTTVKVFEGVPEYLDLHLERLASHCAALNIPKPDIKQDVVDHYIALQGAKMACWRLKIMATATHLGMTLQPYSAPTVSSYRLCVYPEPVMRPTARLKSLSYLDRWWIKDYAQKQGCDEAVVVDGEDNILETAFGNIYWRLGNRLFLPDLTLPLLVGVGLQVVMQKARDMQQEIHQVRAKLQDIPNDAQVYVCNALTGSIPVREIARSALECGGSATAFQFDASS